MKIRTLFLFLLVSTICFANNPVKEKLLTVAEKSSFESTSRYQDVINFFKQLKKISGGFRIDYIGTSTNGLDIPLIVMGKPLPKSDIDLKKEKRIVVYLQANIHAGEVEGKEAVQMLARDIMLKETPDYLKDVILLIAPIFNCDGNEPISKQNRPHQNGPLNGVGVRHNGQMLDLNRDAMKVETPEVTGLITNVLNKWDPALTMDIHTTNGSYHTEPTTYTWMVNPNTERNLISYMRDKMMPWVKNDLTINYKWQNLFYGEFLDQRYPEKGWVYHAVQPRYIVNYIGLRNRLAILTENYVYADFKTRVMGTYYLLKSVLEYAAANKDEIKKMLKEADEKTIARGLNPSEQDSVAIEFENKPSSTPEVINAYEVEPYKDANGSERYKPTERIKTVSVPYYVDYFPKRSVQFPFAYLITQPDKKVIGLLKTHGIKIEKLVKPVTLDVETIKTKELKPAQRLNQGHYTNTIKVDYVNEKKEFAAGTLVVRTAQALANVAAYLLEPESDDGLLHWNFWDKYLVPQWGSAFLSYPVTKVLTKQEIVTVELK
ncbi:MAG: M14 family metallopeptidase [Bacteroidota bacterium]